MLFRSNLIDLDLQKRIANCKDMDRDATEALTLLLEQKPATLKNDLEDWTLEKVDDKNILFSKERIIYLETMNYDGTLLKCFTITKQWDIRES